MINRYDDTVESAWVAFESQLGAAIHGLEGSLCINVERLQTPTVRIFSYLACGVASRTQARLEADVLNRRYRHLKFHVLDRTLQVEIDVPGMPFVAAHFRAMIDLAAEVVEELTPDVALRTRGHTINEQSPHGQADSA